MSLPPQLSDWAPTDMSDAFLAGLTAAEAWARFAADRAASVDQAIPRLAADRAALALRKEGRGGRGEMFFFTKAAGCTTMRTCELLDAVRLFTLEVFTVEQCELD